MNMLPRSARADYLSTQVCGHISCPLPYGGALLVMAPLKGLTDVWRGAGGDDPRPFLPSMMTLQPLRKSCLSTEWPQMPTMNFFDRKLKMSSV